VNKLDYWAETIDELAILVPIVFECLQVLLKKEEDGIGRITALDLVGERIFIPVCSAYLSNASRID